MAKVFKAIVAILILALLGAVVYATVTSTGNGNGNVEKARIISVDEIKIPKKVDADNLFGLFFFNEDGSKTSTMAGYDKINFDPKKPTVIFIHGMQMNNGYNDYDPIPNPLGWLEAGYNFGVYFWSQFADCETPGNGKLKIWLRGNGWFYYEDDNGKRVKESEDVLEYTTSEVFVAYYLDLLKNVNYSGSSITIAGHSLGANTTIAATSYLVTLYDQGSIEKSVLPDRVVLLDAYMDAVDEEGKTVPWLNTTIGKDGIIGRARTTMKRAHEIGISTEYVKSCTFVSFLSDLATYEGMSKTLFDEMLYIDFNNDYTGLNFGDSHVASMDWWLNSISASLRYDSAVADSGVLGYTARTPLSVTYARNKTWYEMESNMTRYNYDDDVQFSTNVEKPVIAGFAFNDVNGNGINDDRLFNRVQGIKVELYDGNTKIAETVTTEGGYYEFVIDGSYSGKNYRIKAILNNGMSFGKSSDGGYMNNGVGGDGYSEVINLNNKIDLKIVNIGIKLG